MKKFIEILQEATSLDGCQTVSCVHNKNKKCSLDEIDISPGAKCKYFKKKTSGKPTSIHEPEEKDDKTPEFDEVEENGRIRYIRKK